MANRPSDDVIKRINDLEDQLYGALQEVFSIYEDLIEYSEERKEEFEQLKKWGEEIGFDWDEIKEDEDE